MPKIDRRQLLVLLAAASGARGALAQEAAALQLGPPRPFSFEALVTEARRAAAGAYVPPVIPSPEVLQRIGYDQHWRIRFREDLAPLIGDDRLAVQFFHLGRFFREPATAHLVSDGQARELIYDDDLFEMPENSPAHELGPGAGFAGLRVMRPNQEPDWISFLGASYFRCDGPERQYGLSARGLAVGTGLSRPEEFPRFSAFYVGEGEREGEDVVIYTRMDSPSLAGAYRFGARRRGAQGQRVDVEARLFFRRDVERLGVAPLTSMYWYSETNHYEGDDWRPEIHDSDGLALHTGAGERIWRPLRNPWRVTTSSFVDENPRGFGLIQRDRDFENYQDDGVFYNRRPSAWITPKGDWGRGAVQLVEIPTHDETFDNIVAYWTPEAPVGRGAALSFDYTIDWIARDPLPARLGRVVATRIGSGGVPGQPRPEGLLKIVIDFEGGRLPELDDDDGVELDLTAQGGTIVRTYAHRIVDHEGWRANFDIDGAFERPVELRAYLRHGGAPLTETWTMLLEREPGTTL